MRIAVLNWLSQIFAVTRFSLLSVPERKGAAIATIFGIAGVVGVLVGVLSIAEGFKRALTSSGSPDRAIILRAGSDTEMTSGLTKDDARLVGDAPGVERNAEGPAASAELYVIINLPKRLTGTDANVPLRGVEQAAYKVRKEVQLVQGRRFEPGRNEVIVGCNAALEFKGLELGGQIPVAGGQWTVVGIFSCNGGVAESEIWTDANLLQSAYRRGDGYSSMYVKLNSDTAFKKFKDEITSNPRLNLKVVREDEFYAEQSQLLVRIITGLGTLIAGLMGVGAVFGALNTMYSAVSARTREIATLRALGFGGGPVVISVLLESLALALAGGILGGGLAYLMFNDYHAATMNWSSFSQVAFAFAVTPNLLIQGAIYAAVIGFFGGLFPALRAARMPIAVGLREL